MRRFPPKRILVAADLSAPSLSALAVAKALARRWGAALEIVYVRHPPLVTAWVGPNSMPFGVPTATAQPKRRVEEKLRKAAAGFPADRLKLRTVNGWPPAELLELARPRRADLMVMGTHGYAGLDRVLTGSVAEAVVRRARIPVLVVPEKTETIEGLSRVLAPWNARPYATRALRWARELSRSLRSTLDVLHVAESGLAIPKVLDRRLQAILGAGPDWNLRTRKGDPRERIIADIGSGRYELVVLSAHRRAFASDFALGSTVERVLRHTTIPILAVPSGTAAR